MSPLDTPSAVPAPSQRPSRLLAGIYHDIGLAAVAQGLGVDVTGLAHETVQAVSRGARYIHLMPKRHGIESPLLSRG